MLTNPCHLDPDYPCWHRECLFNRLSVTGHPFGPSCTRKRCHSEFPASRSPRFFHSAIFLESSEMRPGAFTTSLGRETRKILPGCRGLRSPRVTIDLVASARFLQERRNWQDPASPGSTPYHSLSRGGHLGQVKWDVSIHHIM